MRKAVWMLALSAVFMSGCRYLRTREIHMYRDAEIGAQADLNVAFMLIYPTSEDQLSEIIEKIEKPGQSFGDVVFWNKMTFDRSDLEPRSGGKIYRLDPNVSEYLHGGSKKPKQIHYLVIIAQFGELPEGESRGSDQLEYIVLKSRKAPSRGSDERTASTREYIWIHQGYMERLEREPESGGS